MAQDHDAAASAAAEAMERALLKATQTVERELTRIVRTGEEDLDRLARRLIETLAEVTLDAALGSVVGERAPAPGASEGAAPASSNQLAAAISRAARRGARFL